MRRFPSIKSIKNLLRLIRKGETRALLISATGTGKTFAAAFALREIKAEKILFLVHRKTLTVQAMQAFRKIFPPNKTMGLFSSKNKVVNEDIIFATMQTMSKEEILKKFSREAFEFIVIDEVHRAGSNSYQKIMEYFKPKFWLGMTASPERTDDFDIYGLFHRNIAYEIHLQQALEENLLCPFHYYGITDLEIDGRTFDDKEFRNFNLLTSEKRVNYIIEKANYFGYSGTRVKGLIFCSKIKEAQCLSQKFNEKGYRTICLTGEDSEEDIEKGIERLVTDSQSDYLDYIFTVDIFNEGVDIPEINQIIMLRPTESPIIFIQQFGRGLRNADGKEYVIVLDFIGNYNNNYMIPIALSGDKSYNKDSIRRYLMEGNRLIPGSSTVHFDEISRKRIFSSIDRANMNTAELIKSAYTKLKQRLGHIPSLVEFEDYGEIDVLKIFEKYGSYHEFLKKVEKKDYTISFEKEEEQILNYISKKFSSGKRIQELDVLDRVLKYRKNLLCKNSHVRSELDEKSIVANLNSTFLEGNRRSKFCEFLEKKDGEYVCKKDFLEKLQNPVFKSMLQEAVDLGLKRNRKYYSRTYKETDFVLYKTYSREEICRLLKWERNISPQILAGYFYEPKTSTMPVFINYDKAKDDIAYKDRFISPRKLIAISKKNKRLDSIDVTRIYGAKEQGNRIYLFVRKNTMDREFYFLGEIFAVGKPNPIKMEDGKTDAFEITYELEEEVREDIYEYLIN